MIRKMGSDLLNVDNYLEFLEYLDDALSDEESYKTFGWRLENDYSNLLEIGIEASQRAFALKAIQGYWENNTNPRAYIREEIERIENLLEKE